MAKGLEVQVRRLMACEDALLDIGREECKPQYPAIVGRGMSRIDEGLERLLRTEPAVDTSAEHSFDGGRRDALQVVLRCGPAALLQLGRHVVAIGATPLAA